MKLNIILASEDGETYQVNYSAGTTDMFGYTVPRLALAETLLSITRKFQDAIDKQTRRSKD
jgi:hypothetical protein